MFGVMQDGLLSRHFRPQVKMVKRMFDPRHALYTGHAHAATIGLLSHDATAQLQAGPVMRDGG